MVVDYRKVISVIISYSHSLRNMEQPFEHFGGAVVFKFNVLSNPLYVSKSSDDCLIQIIRPF